jgi:hypothetical protein
MKHFRFAALGSVAFVMSWAVGPVRAQATYGRVGVGQINRPVYSPYLNLLRTGNPVYANYYGLVRPEVELRSAASTLQQEVFANQQGISGLEAATTTLTTGHATRFLNTSGYFLNRGGQGGQPVLTTTPPARPANVPANVPATARR